MWTGCFRMMKSCQICINWLTKSLVNNKKLGLCLHIQITGFSSTVLLWDHSITTWCLTLDDVTSFIHSIFNSSELFYRLRRWFVSGRPVISWVVKRSTKNRSKNFGRFVGHSTFGQWGRGSSPSQNLGGKIIGKKKRTVMIGTKLLQCYRFKSKIINFCSRMQPLDKPYYKDLSEMLTHDVFTWKQVNNLTTCPS